MLNFLHVKEQNDSHACHYERGQQTMCQVAFSLSYCSSNLD